MEPNAGQHPELAVAFNALVRAASSLLLEFHLDLASATVSLARRIRSASFSGEAEIRSILAGVEGLTARIHLLPSPAPQLLQDDLDSALDCLKGFQPQRRELIFA